MHSSKNRAAKSPTLVSHSDKPYEIATAGRKLFKEAGYGNTCLPRNKLSGATTLNVKPVKRSSWSLNPSGLVLSCTMTYIEVDS